MITDELNELKQQLQDFNPVFNNNVFVYSRFQENDNNFKGITDQFDSYAYIEIIEDDDETFAFDEVEELSGKGGYNVQSEIKLIAGFCNVDLEKAIESLIGQVNDLGHTILSASVNSELIYQEETEEELRKDIQLIKITFQVNKLKTFNRCITSIC